MKQTKPILTETTVFQGREAVTINTEIPKEVYDQILLQYKKELTSGQTSLTIEQFAGSFMQLGFNWALYSSLKKVFDK